MFLLAIIIAHNSLQSFHLTASTKCKHSNSGIHQRKMKKVIILLNHTAVLSNLNIDHFQNVKENQRRKVVLLMNLNKCYIKSNLSRRLRFKTILKKKKSKGSYSKSGGHFLGGEGWGCASGTLESLAYTSASSAEFCYPILDLTP